MGFNYKAMGKLLIITGFLLLVVGVFIYFSPKLPRIPGDIMVKKENFSFYFPIGTSILISIILSLVFFLIQKFK